VRERKMYGERKRGKYEEKDMHSACREIEGKRAKKVYAIRGREREKEKEGDKRKKS